MRIIEVEEKSYELVYEDVAHNGYGFPCDERGNLSWKKVPHPETAPKELAYCKAHPEKWTGRNGEVITVYSRERYGICPYCGHKISFCGSGYMGAYECTCGQWYNLFGQELLPPEDWDEPIE